MIEIFKGEDGWYWRVLGLNGESLCVSESYTRQEDAVRGAHDLVIVITQVVCTTTIKDRRLRVVESG